MTPLILRTWKAVNSPGARRFRQALRDPRRAQLRVLADILAATRGGPGQGGYERFRARPLTEYDDYRDAVTCMTVSGENLLTRENVRLLEPTSGSSSSSSATKLIPYTPLLRRQFQAAIQPWIADTFRRRPETLNGPHYWAVSPATRVKQDSAIPIGFDDDASYLAGPQAWLARRVWAVPPALREVRDPETWQWLTLLCLARCRNLRLVSVWHPSFLTLMLDRLADRRQEICAAIRRGGVPERLGLGPDVCGKLAVWLPPDRSRARELAECGACPSRIWPNLCVVSCWAGPAQEPWLTCIRQALPQARVEPKGLVATEGITTIPFAGAMPLAIRSHFFEFEDERGDIHPAWEIAEGRTYRLLLSTGSGFLRYQTHDRVRVTGFLDQTPCLEFVGRDATCDLVGEKLAEEHVAQVLQAILPDAGFRMLAPWQCDGARGYLVCSPVAPDTDVPALLDAVEAELRGNYHYAHARSLGQLAPLRHLPAPPDAADRYRRGVASRTGCRVGDVKFPAIHRAGDLQQLCDSPCERVL